MEERNAMLALPNSHCDLCRKRAIDPEKARERCWGCGGTITARMDSFCCEQGGTILGTKDTRVPKNLEPDTSDSPSLCTTNPPIHQLFLSKSTGASLGIFGPQNTSLLAQG